MENKTVVESKVVLESQIIEQVLIGADLSKLSAEHRTAYYSKVCESLGLNPLTKPFDYIVLNGKMQLYARKDCTEQLRSNRKISLKIVARETVNDVYVVTAQATMPDGRFDESIGAVSIKGVTSDALANCIMKSETKAKRRVTLSICGLGMLDEAELETTGAGFSNGKPQVHTPVPVTVNKPEIIEAQTSVKISDNDIKVLKAAEKHIGADAFACILGEFDCKSIDEVPTKEVFNKINVRCFEVFQQQKKAKAEASNVA